MIGGLSAIIGIGGGTLTAGNRAVRFVGGCVRAQGHRADAMSAEADDTEEDLDASGPLQVAMDLDDGTAPVPIPHGTDAT